MKNKIILLILFAFHVSYFSAQKASDAPALPAQVKVKLPEMLSSYKPQQMESLQQEFKNGSGWGQNKRAKAALWVVFSDRAENPTYTSPDKTKRLSQLDFGEKVCIADIQGDMALVYKDDKARYPDIPSTITSKGWIPMDKLLLWNKCPTDQRGVQKKGIIAINLNKMSKDEKFQSKKYSSPENLSKSTALNTNMNFYYVMKETEDGEYALLCNGAQVNNAQTFYGWVNKNAYTEWNQRSCLEPNWLPKFVETHIKKRTYVYEDAQRSANATWWEYGTTNGDKNPLYKYRMNPHQLRFPILSQPDGSGMVQCTSFADRTQGSINNANKFVGSISNTVNKIGKEVLQMNVILAVEATTDMGKYLPAVKEALSICKDYANQGLTVKVGLILYRSLSEGTSGVTIVPLSNYDDTRLQDMLNVKMANSRLSSERNVALSQAIEQAINGSKMGFNKNQSNLLLVVGYHGTDESVWSDKELLKKMEDNNIQLASIQVMRSSSGSSKRYFDIMENLVKENIETQYKNVGVQAVFQHARDKKGSLSNDGYFFTSSRPADKGGNFLYASVRYNKAQDQEMVPEDLTRYVKNSIEAFSRSISANKNILEESLSADLSDNSNDIRDDVMFYTTFLKKKLGEQGYKNWLQVKAITAYGGYAQIKGLGDDDYWRAILYLSADELNALIVKLKDISEAANEQNPDRTKYVKAIKDLLSAQLGGSIPDKEIEEMDPDKLEEAIYGIVNVKSENMRFTKYSLKDLISRKSVTDDEYFDILDRFDKKYKKLSKISSGYDYRMEVGGMYYYWIPLEDLP